jgi:hypothetical protein
MQVEPTCMMSNTQPNSLLRPPLSFLLEDSSEEIIDGNPSCKTMQPSAKELPLRMADDVLRSIMQTRFRQLSKQDFAVISELTEVYDHNCKYQLLLVGLRRKLGALSGELSPRPTPCSYLFVNKNSFEQLNHSIERRHIYSPSVFRCDILSTTQIGMCFSILRIRRNT